MSLSGEGRRWAAGPEGHLSAPAHPQADFITSFPLHSRVVKTCRVPLVKPQQCWPCTSSRVLRSVKRARAGVQNTCFRGQWYFGMQRADVITCEEGISVAETISEDRVQPETFEEKPGLKYYIVGASVIIGPLTHAFQTYHDGWTSAGLGLVRFLKCFRICTQHKDFRLS